ncbi:MAG TPA: aromatic acid/H+ symport family MFS transporter [Micropepsaceae bacterium]|nr:aromatic acid/H+ symport family MFS transporter [Micropepsaceae bacterium]
MTDATAPKLGAVPEAGAAGRIQWLALVLCGLTVFVEGYDAQFMGYIVPGIAADWSIAPPVLTPALTMGLLGLMFGAFFIAPLADTYGRRKLVIYSVAAFGLLTIATALAETLPVLVAFRFLTGLGLGASMPNAIALTAEFSPPGRRVTAVAMMFAAFSIGAAFGGIVTAALMPTYGWQSVFIFCGALALVLLPVLIVAMPESYAPGAEAKAKIPVGQLFAQGRARITILIWVIFFMNIMELYFITSWLPTTLNAQGLTVTAGVIATTLVQVAGAATAFVVGPLVDRYGPQWLLPLVFLLGAVCIAAMGLVGSSVAIAMVTAFGIGIGTVGAQNGNNGVAAKFYPTAIRATGVGWALAVGRIGSILGPLIGGVLLATKVDIRTIFLFAAIPPLIAAVAYFLMGRPPELASED